MMRHATIQAIRKLSGVDPVTSEFDQQVQAPETAACDWESDAPDYASLGATDAGLLLVGVRVELPTCPECAVFVDLALELRGSQVGG